MGCAERRSKSQKSDDVSNLFAKRENESSATLAHRPSRIYPAAHDRNDETLERIYIGRRFRNDTERLEKLFDLYTKMTPSVAPVRKRKTEARA